MYYFWVVCDNWLQTYGLHFLYFESILIVQIFYQEVLEFDHLEIQLRSNPHLFFAVDRPEAGISSVHRFVQSSGNQWKPRLIFQQKFSKKSDKTSWHPSKFGMGSTSFINPQNFRRGDQVWYLDWVKSNLHKVYCKSANHTFEFCPKKSVWIISSLLKSWFLWSWFIMRRCPLKPLWFPHWAFPI